MTSLNPLFTIGNQLMEAILIHKKDWSKKQAQERAIEMLNLVGSSESRRIDEGLSSSTIWWDETAGHDCDGAGM